MSRARVATVLAVACCCFAHAMAGDSRSRLMRVEQAGDPASLASEKTTDKLKKKVAADKKAVRDEVKKQFQAAHKQITDHVKKVVSKEMQKDKKKDSEADAELAKGELGEKTAEKKTNEDKKKQDKELNAKESAEKAAGGKKANAKQAAAFKKWLKQNEKGEMNEVGMVDKKVHDMEKFLGGKAAAEWKDVQKMIKTQKEKNCKQKGKAVKDAAAKAKTVATKVAKVEEENEDSKILRNVDKWATEMATEVTQKLAKETLAPEAK